MSTAAPMWLTASDLAGLPGLTGDRRTIHLRAARERWTFKEAQQVGGTTRLYSVDNLPPEARAELERRRREAEQLVTSAVDEHYRTLQLARSVVVPAWAEARATARLAILQARDIFAVGCIGMNKAAVNRAFAAGFNDGRIKVPGVEAVRIRRISERTLFRWEAASAGGARGLGGAAAEKRGWSVIDDDPQLVNAILSILKDKPHIRLKHLYEALCASFPETKDGDRVTRPALPDRVSMRSLARWLEGFKARNRARWMQMLDPDKAKGHFQVAFGSRSIDVIRLNQRWETDATKFDVMCVDGRHAVVGVMDIYSRRARVRVCKRAASNAYDVGCTMRRGILDWGLPEQLISDNGADFTAAFIDLFCEALEIEHKTCAPYHGEEKPHIERFFGTIQHDVVELLPGFCGHSVAQAQTIRSRKTYQQRQGKEDREIYEVKLTAEQLQTRLDEWMAVYEQTTHSELGMSPAAKAASWTQPARKIDDERKLDVLLAPVVRANKPPTVGKRGLTIDGGLYVDREAVLAEWVGKQVHVRRDPADLGRVWVFDGEGHFICVAENRERLGFSLAEVAAKGHERQKAMQKRWKQEERAADKEFHVDDIAELILEERRRNAAKVVELRPAPVPEPEIFSTPALEAAAEVLASQQQRSAPVPEEVLERGRAVIRSMDEARAAREAAEAKAADEDAAFIARWVDLADGGLQSASEFDKAWFERMAARDPKIRAWVLLKRPDLQPLLARAAAARR